MELRGLSFPDKALESPWEQPKWRFEGYLIPICKQYTLRSNSVKINPHLSVIIIIVGSLPCNVNCFEVTVVVIWRLINKIELNPTEVTCDSEIC